jgi:hypothetical protein
MCSQTLGQLSNPASFPEPRLVRDDRVSDPRVAQLLATPFLRLPCVANLQPSCTAQAFDLRSGGKNIRLTQPIRARFPAANNAERMDSCYAFLRR